MKKILFVLMAAIFLMGGIALQPVAAAAPTGDIKVITDNLRSTNGQFTAQLFNSKEGFQAYKPYKTISVKITDGKAEVVFADIPYGKYAIQVVHDENGNGRFDMSDKGLPVEGFGFSNNVVGPPNYDGSEFTLDAKKIEAEISATYLN